MRLDKTFGDSQKKTQTKEEHVDADERRQKPHSVFNPPMELVD